MANTTREQDVTAMVSLWIVNDGQHYPFARYYATGHSAKLPIFLIEVLKDASEHSAAWHVAQELSPNDYTRIDWAQVASDLSGD